MALTFLLGYDTDEELAARVKVGELENAYNSRVLGKFDDTGHLSLTQRGAGICIDQMHGAQSKFENLRKRYASTSAMESQETRILEAKILNSLKECEDLATQRG